MRGLSCALAAIWIALATAADTAHAVDGITEISQACVATGCFLGDAANFPVTISASGSYRLTSNLALPDQNTTGILITGSHVSLDLNGFTIHGDTACTGTPVTSCTPTGIGDGITASGDNVAVSNGTVQGAGRWGIFLGGHAARIERVRAQHNGSSGLVVGGNSGGTSGTVRDCTTIRNGTDGIFLGDEGLAEGNVSRWNARHGILPRTASTVVGNTLNANGDWGLLNSGSAPSGYAGNVISGNGSGTVSGAVEMGTNLCNGNTTCP